MEPPEDNSNSGHNLLPIGQFSILSGLSRNALRLYDALGFLQPTEVDRWTGYRSYSDALLARARLINLMRAMDMPLATIRQVLAAAEQVRNGRAQPAISITRHVKVYALDSTIGECLDKTRAYATRISATASEAAAPFAMCHGPITDEEDGGMEVRRSVSRALEGEGEIE